MNISVIILAAGKGTRMKSRLPKVLHKISGFPMLYFAIREAKKISDDITVVLYHEADLVKERMQVYFDDIRFVLQDHANYPGTGGAVMNIPHRHDKVLVLNGDMPLVEAEELEKFGEIDADIVMSVIELADSSGYGRVVIEKGEVQRIVEEKDATEEEKAIKTVNAGVYLFRKEMLERYLPRLSNENAQQEYYLTDVAAALRERGMAVAVVRLDDPEEMQGVSFRDLVSGKTDEYRDAVYYTYYEFPSVHMVKRHYGVANERYKLMHFYYDIDEWELYDLETDPDEMNNVYGNPDYAGVQKKMHVKLEELREHYGDSDENDKRFLKEYLDHQERRRNINK